MTYNTDRKNEIIKLLSDEHDYAFTTEEICERLLTGGGKSTVYRIISELTEGGVIKKLSDRTSRKVRYQYLGNRECSEHLHLKCRICERLIHLDKSTTEHIMNYISSADSFMLDPTEILGGICGLCKERERKNASSVSASHV